VQRTGEDENNGVSDRLLFLFFYFFFYTPIKLP
jgi:hypothetical protein